MQLLIDKLDPPVKVAHYVSRPRLLNMLAESLPHCTSTIISARAGTGKTQLAAGFSEHCGRRSAWYKVDAADADLNGFLQYLIASINGDKSGIRPDVAGYLTASSVEALAHNAGLVVYKELERINGEPLLIVIDDLHLVYDAEWVKPFFKWLLPVLPPNVHMVIASRSLPPIPLWRMRSKQTLRVIDEAALAFTLPEAQQLFRELNLAEEHADAVLEHTRGRAALLAMAAYERSAKRKTGSSYMLTQ